MIFITAYPDRFLTGERPEPAFLITKPFQPDMVKAIVSQALFFERRAGCARPLDCRLARVCKRSKRPACRAGASPALDLSEQQENKKDHQDQSDHA